MGAHRPETWGLFGGAGFIGQHLALSILNRYGDDRVVILDLVDPAEGGWRVPMETHLRSDRLNTVRFDVRDAAQFETLGARFDVIVNLAAIHREPGHRAAEFFETNVAGARNLCSFAAGTGCREIIFTSSISVYGIHDRPVDETTHVEPRTPYGHSKHEAEQIHIDWARNCGGRLSIVRPGVVFGPGEHGNVTRLVKEMLVRRRPICLQPDQPKAGIYIEELLSILHWLRDQPLDSGQHHLVNGVSNENLTFNAYGEALGRVRDFADGPLNVPGGLIRSIATLSRPLGALIPATSKFHPERLAKICRANDVRASELKAMGYPFEWPLQHALADWLAKGI